MTDQPAPFLSDEETAARRAERATPFVDVSEFGRFEIPRRPMTHAEAVAAFLHAVVVAEVDRRR